MSWAEDMGFDAYDEEDISRAHQRRELEWMRGIHVTREGEQLKLKEMTITHLQNTIAYFDGLDVSPLEKELKRRKKLKAKRKLHTK